MAAYFMNPANRYIEKATSRLTWMWALLFGSWYFLFRGAWPHALVILLMYGVLAPLADAFWKDAPGVALFIILLPHIIYAPFSYAVIAKAYRRAGWIETTPEHEASRLDGPAFQAHPAVWTNDRRRV